MIGVKVSLRVASLVMATLVALMASVEPVHAEYRSIQMRVYGLDCGLCARGVAASVERLPGVKSVDVDVKTGMVDIVLVPGNTFKLSELRKRIRENGFRPMEGTVTAIRAYEVGEVSTTRTSVATIADQSQFVFEIRGLSPEHYDPDTVYIINIDWEPYEAVLVDPEEMGIIFVQDDRTVHMKLIGDDLPVFGINSNMTFRYTMDEALDVVRIPFNALNTAGERTFVYVPVDGLRTTQDIVIGLRGIGFIEVISGLQEGDVVYVN